MPRDKSLVSIRNREDYTFFWTTNHKNGWGSQWYPAPFTAAVTVDGDAGEELLHFPTTEHWMMFQKALLFSDIEIARQVMQITSTRKSDMKSVKALGRKVKNFDEKIWQENRKKIVLEGNVHKFRQNEGLKRKLLETGETTIVEASPRDRIWGIGYGEKNALDKFDKWGLNLLGDALMETRRVLKEEEAEKPNSNRVV